MFIFHSSVVLIFLNNNFQGCLYLWDITKGYILRAVSLGDHDASIFIHQVQIIGNSVVVCDYDRELRVIRFPSILEKVD